MSWKNPPPVVAIGGTETFLVSREIRKAILVTERSGRRVVRAGDDAEAVDNLTMADTFGDACLIIIPGNEVSSATVKDIQEHQPAKTGIIIHVDGALDEKKCPALREVHGAYQVQHNTPKDRKGKRTLALRFARAESASLLGGNKDALDSKLAEALIGAIGTDLGVISFEIAKMAAFARAQGSNIISVDHVRALLRPSSEIDMSPLREALKNKNATKVAAALDRIRRTSGSDPVMLLLRARGGPADLALKWLRTAVLLESGASVEEIAMRTDTPEWATKRDLIPAAKRWGVSPLRNLVNALSRVDRGVLLGAPSPWVSCESALLLGCAG
jgi:DNA polymerase III delta subunit